MLASRLALVAALLAACSGRPSGADEPSPPSGPDAPYDLADDNDLELQRAELAAMPSVAPGRAALRRRLADEYDRRLGAAIERGQPDAIYEILGALLDLWPAEDLRTSRTSDLQRYRDHLAAARQVFARAGKDVETVVALGALLIADPAGAAAHRTEIDEIFGYADDLAMAEDGACAERARPIEILEQVFDVHPAPWVVDRLVTLYVERQRALDGQFRQSGADLDCIRAHGDAVVRTAWHIGRVMARGGRVAEAPAIIEGVGGIGDDPQLRARLKRALASGATGPDWVLVAARYHSPDPEAGDFAAALAFAREAIARFPESPVAYLAAAESARQLGEEPLAITYYEAGLERDPDHDEAAGRLAELYIARIDALARTHRPAAAARLLARFEAFHRRAERALGTKLEPDRADALGALGRGLVALGEIDAGTRYLERSIALRPTMEALEQLGTVALKREQYDRAVELYQRALDKPAAEPLARYQQCRVQRLVAEAYLGAGRKHDAITRLRAALLAWHKLTREVDDLPAPVLAEALVEQGKILWTLGKHQAALVAFDAAVDADDDGASSNADVVAFLIVRGQYDRALDAYHRALGNHSLAETLKVYMSLWVMAEARRQGRGADPIARDYLAERDGPLWYDDLARFANGRIGAAALAARANTRGRRAELLYYSAVLGAGAGRPDEARRLLERVLATDMVLFFEYDMAKHWLKSGFQTGR